MTAHWREDMKYRMQDEQVAPDSSMVSIAGQRIDAADRVERGFRDC